MTKPLSIAFFAIAFCAHAGSSAHYSVAPDTVDHGGLRATSTHYTFDGSAMPGGAGESTSYTIRSGYAGQLSDVVALMEIGLELSAPQLTVNEGGTLQLSASVLYDDTSTAPLDPSSITWSVQSGPLSGINASGLATAAAVYQNSPAVAQGTYQTFTDTLSLTVLNTQPDNFGSYAVEFSTTLLGNSWSALTTFTTSDAGPQRTVTDTNATGVRKFYRVQIAKIPNP